MVRRLARERPLWGAKRRRLLIAILLAAAAVAPVRPAPHLQLILDVGQLLLQLGHPAVGLLLPLPAGRRDFARAAGLQAALAGAAVGIGLAAHFQAAAGFARPQPFGVLAAATRDVVGTWWGSPWG